MSLCSPPNCGASALMILYIILNPDFSMDYFCCSTDAFGIILFVNVVYFCIWRQTVISYCFMVLFVFEYCGGIHEDIRWSIVVELLD